MKTIKGSLSNLYSSCQVEQEKEYQNILISTLASLGACTEPLITPFIQPPRFHPHAPLSRDS